MFHSDRRWKKNIRAVANALENVEQLHGVSFEWRQDEYEGMNFPGGRHIGLIAQEVEDVFPELVYTDREGYKSVEYANLVPVLIEAMQTQQRQIEALKARLEALEQSDATNGPAAGVFPSGGP